MTDRSEDELARALFAAAARERAPEELRAALLRQAQQLPSTAEQRTRAGSGPSGARSWLWLPLAAAALTLAWLGWRGLATEPEILVSREQTPEPPTEHGARSAEPVAVEPPSPRPPAPAARAPSVPRSRPARRVESAPVLPPAAPALEVAPAAPALEVAPAAPVAPQVTVAEQLDVLQRARRALRAGAANEALQLLAAEERALAGSEFAAEARLLRIEALASANRRSEARALARDFVRRYPHDPLVDRARQFEEEAVAPR